MERIEDQVIITQEGCDQQQCWSNLPSMRIIERGGGRLKLEAATVTEHRLIGRTRDVGEIGWHVENVTVHCPDKITDIFYDYKLQEWTRNVNQSW